MHQTCNRGVYEQACHNPIEHAEITIEPAVKEMPAQCPGCAGDERNECQAKSKPGDSPCTVVLTDDEEGIYRNSIDDYFDIEQCHDETTPERIDGFARMGIITRFRQHDQDRQDDQISSTQQVEPGMRTGQQVDEGKIKKATCKHHQHESAKDAQDVNSGSAESITHGIRHRGDIIRAGGECGYQYINDKRGELFH